MGLVASLNRPGGNATGVSFQTVELVAKQLGMLRAGARSQPLRRPRHPNSAFTDAVIKDLQASDTGLDIINRLVDYQSTD
jgi:putative ABC transport system substrate-binding protein